MNKHAKIALIIIVSLGLGAYFLYGSQSRNAPSAGQGHMVEDTSGKPVAQSHRSYELETTSKLINIKPGQPTTIVYRIKNDKGEILKNYEVVHEKIMHFIVVRRDLQHFQHIHPTFNESTGEFSIGVTFPTDGPYRIFPDFTPAKSQDNPQLLSVTLFKDVEIGEMSRYDAQLVTPDTSGKKTVGEYEVSFLFPKQSELKAQNELTYSLVINKNGQPVKDLENYLGALGHSVILREGNLDFIHTHPKDMVAGAGSAMQHGGSMQAEGKTSDKGPQIDFETSFPESGIYRIFTQFQHQGNVMTVDYTIHIL